MEQSLSEANSGSDAEEILSITCNPKVLRRVHKSLSQMNPIHSPVFL
jgi:hypothetical protein